MKNTKVCVIGLGYVGLPLAALCAIRGHDVIGLERNKNIIDKINLGKSHIQDFQVENLLSKAHKTKKFHATSIPEDASDSEFYLICVPTPVDVNNEPDLSPLYSSIETIGPLIKKNDVVVIESTVFPGTCENEVIPRLNEKTNMTEGVDYFVAHCPERVNPGDDFWTTKNIPRVIGATCEMGAEKSSEFYNSILGGGIIDVREIKLSNVPKFSTDQNGSLKVSHPPLGSITKMKSIRDAEAVKAMENTVRDVNIAFVNELAKISNVLNLNVLDIIDGMSTKPFGKGPFYPGVGVGGHCIAVDPEWLRSASIKAGFIPEIIELARSTNNGMPEYVVSLLEQLLGTLGMTIEGTNILIIGATYKRNVDDMRESPFFEIRKILKKKKAQINVYDSWVSSENTVISLQDGMKLAHAVILVTDHDDIVAELKSMLFSNLPLKVFVDGRNCLPSELVKKHGILYCGVGRR